MSGATDIRAVAARLRQAREAKFRTAKAFADKLGIPQSTYTRQELGQNGLRRDVARKYANALGVTVEWLVFGVSEPGESIRIVGNVRAGHWAEALELPEDEQVGFFAPPLEGFQDRARFGLRVVGHSMDRLYPPGSVVDCVEIREGDLEPGCRFIVERVDKDGMIEATVKELQVGLDGQWLLYPRSHHPDHQSPVVWDPENTESVRIVALVVGSYQRESVAKPTTPEASEPSTPANNM
jgi:transcriptional regulator with XRE-family HTH domain